MVSLAQKARIRGLSRTFPAIFRRDVDTRVVRLGSEYGGWWIPPDMLGPDSICYLAGVGTDITFDLALMRRFGCGAWGIDPTPKTIDWIKMQGLPERYTFLPVGLAGEQRKLRFYAPDNPDHVSHSVINLQRTNTYIEATCTTVAALMDQLGHERVDLLKMDIEGAQHMVIDSLIRDQVFPRVICVEFDQPEPLADTRRSLGKLRGVGYDLAKVEGFNMTLVRHQS